MLSTAKIAQIDLKWLGTSHPMWTGPKTRGKGGLEENTPFKDPNILKAHLLIILIFYTIYFHVPNLTSYTTYITTSLKIGSVAQMDGSQNTPLPHTTNTEFLSKTITIYIRKPNNEREIQTTP